MLKTRPVTIFSGQHFDVPQCIQRIDTHSTHGWQVRYQGTKMFSDHTPDGSGAAHALQAAEGGGLRGIVAQIERLAVQVGERAEITLEDVLETVSTTKESSVFEIVDAAAACETEKVLGLVGRLFDIGSTDVAGKRTTDSSAIFLRLLPLLSERFHQLGRLRELERDGVGFEQAAATVFGESKAWLFPRFRVQAAARTPRALGDAVLALARLEHRLKTGGGEARELFETFLVEHGSPLPHARARFGR